MAKRKSKITGVTAPEHKLMQLQAAENALAEAIRKKRKYNQSADKRIRSLEKLIAELREELGCNSNENT